MVRVCLGATLSNAAGGRREFEVEARNIMQLLKALSEQYPELAPTIDRGVAVAIDGQIYNNALLQTVPDNAEVYLMPKASGG